MIHDVPTDRRNRASKQCLGFSLPEHIFSKRSSINSGELIISPIYFPLKIPHLHIFLSARKKARGQPHLQYARTDRRNRVTFINFPHLTGAVRPLIPFKGHNKDGYKSKKGQSVWS